MAANFNQTNKNQDRYFFATVEEGEQDLYVSTIAAGALTDYYVGITGSGGNLVQINQMPDVIGTKTTGGEEMLYAGTASTYKTLSSIAANASGISLSTDREPGSGVATIESYGTNGSLRGYEFLSRGVNSELLSTNSAGINNYMSSIGRPAATMVLGTSGTLLTSGVQASAIQSLDYPSGGGGRGCFNINDLSGANGLTSVSRWSLGTTGIPTGSNSGSDYAMFSYDDSGNFIVSPLQIKRSTAAMNIVNLSSVNGVAYPQNLLSSLVSGSQGVVANSNVVSLLFSHNSASTSNMIPGQNYLIDFPANIATGAPGGSGAWLDLGLRAGSNGSFNYLHSMFIPPGGTPVQGVAAGLVQVCDMGTTNQNIDLVGYLQGVASLSISTIQVGGGSLAYMKMLT
jgi:hypothetical protein